VPLDLAAQSPLRWSTSARRPTELTVLSGIQVAFIKQEALEKAREIKVKADEVSPD